MRFFLDDDVPVSVASMLRGHGHVCRTAADAGLAAEGQDDNLSVYADERQAVVATLDREFTLRRRKNPIGRHIQLRCTEPEAAQILESTWPARCSEPGNWRAGWWTAPSRRGWLHP